MSYCLKYYSEEKGIVKKDNYLVSIITAAYNCGETISETIDSVLAQTWSNWEMIIVDDCSKDDTEKIVKKYAEYDPRIRLISLDKNSGSAVARNVAINHSRGRFIAILDSDDLWKPKKLELQLRFMLKNDYAFTFTEYEVFKNSNDIKRKVFSVPESINYNQYLNNTIIGCLTVVVDKEKIPDFHMETGYLEDILTWMYYLKNGIVAYGLKQNLACYRIASNSKSSNKIKNAMRYYQCLKTQDNLGNIRAIYSEVCYIFNAVKKRLFGKKVIVK